MRRRLAVLVLSACAVFAPAASATLLPNPPSSPAVGGLRTFTLPRPAPLRVGHACMVRTKLARRLVPVACEQPPRSQVLLATLVAF